MGRRWNIFTKAYNVSIEIRLAHTLPKDTDGNFTLFFESQFDRNSIVIPAKSPINIFDSAVVYRRQQN